MQENKSGVFCKHGIVTSLVHFTISLIVHIVQHVYMYTTEQMQ